MKYLGIDLGLRKIGLAISEGVLASPYSIVRIKNKKDAINKISQIALQELVDVLVIGQPEQKLDKFAQGVAQSLKQQGWKVVLADENLSTHQAKKVMIEAGFSRSKRENDDAVAAAIILQNWLDSTVDV